MDQSLDDYIIKRVHNPKPGLSGRLGPKASPQRLKRQQQQQQAKRGNNQQQFKITGLANVKAFDARAKIGKKENTNVRTNIQRNVKDVRSRIGNKANITVVKNVRQPITGPRTGTAPTDARQRISAKGGRLKMTSPITQIKTSVSGDLRMKVNTMKARNVDARQKIKARMGAKQKISGPGQVVVTGLGQPIPTLVAGQQKRPASNTSVQGGGNITRTINVQGPGPKQKQGLAVTTGRGTKVTMTAAGYNRQQIDTTSAQQLPGNPELRPMVKIKNDHYVPPQQPQQQQQQGYYQQQPQQHVSYIEQPQYQQQQQQQYQQHTTYHQPMYSDLEPQQVVIHQQPPVQHYHQPTQAPQAVYHQEQPSTHHIHQNPQFEPVTVHRQHEPVYTSSRPQTTQSAVLPESDPGPFRVMVTNLHPIVSQDDLVELFGSIGALKRARLVRQGIAEVLYMRREDALAACKKYHMRELDGQPMHVNVTSVSKQSGTPKRQSTTPIIARISPPPPPQEHKPLSLGGKPREHTPIRPPVAATTSKRETTTRGGGGRKGPRGDPPRKAVEAEKGMEEEDVAESPAYQPLRLGASEKAGPSRMDIQLVHKALFKTMAPGQPTRPVTFTVKI